MPHPVNNVTRTQFDSINNAIITVRKYTEVAHKVLISEGTFMKAFTYIESIILPLRARTLGVGGNVMVALVSTFLKHNLFRF
jgi:hypothetical protein